MVVVWCGLVAAYAQAPPAATANAEPGRDHQHDVLLKAIDDLMWRQTLGDIAVVDKVRHTGPPPRYKPIPTAPGATNPVIIPAYTFIPQKSDRSRKHPLLVLVHGGVHANFSSSGANVVRELVELGYPVVAPEYRGSTGYGGTFYRLIDYGGLENDDVCAARHWAVETFDFVDPKRVGILGWSHGGMITLMNIFEHPEAYAVAYAGVPVSDLVARLGYKSESYRRIFSAPSHIGKTVENDVMEYRRRSPVFHAHKLATPLLIHTNTNMKTSTSWRWST